MNLNLTLIGQAISFAIFVWFCMKYVWPPIVAAMSEREQKIADGLSAADRAANDLKLAQKEATSKLHEAKEQAATIIDQANKRAAQIVDEAKTAAQDEGQRIKAAAEADIEQQVNRAKEQLRAQVAGLVMAGASQVVESSVDESAHQAIVDKLAASL